VPDTLIDAIKGREEQGVIVVQTPAFTTGQKLRVTEGPFEKLDGVFQCVDDKQRVVLLLEFMGRIVRTHLASHTVTVA